MSDGSKDADEKGRGKVTHARGECRMVNVVSVLMLISMQIKRPNFHVRVFSVDECERIIVIRSVAFVLVAIAT